MKITVDALEGRGLTPRQRRLVLVMAAAIAALAVGVVFFGPAGAQNKSETAVLGSNDTARDHITVLEDGGRFTGPGPDAWPPRPASATDPLISDPDLSASTARRSSSSTSAERRDGRVVAALGDRYSLIASSHPAATNADAPKGAVDTTKTESVYFSLSNNQTVVVESANGTVTEVTTQPASVGQPPFSADERAEAIAIAREHWEDFGADRIDELVGFTIEAYPPEGGVYDVRMGYVSFHVDADSIPELLTWVDLTNGEVHEAQVSR